MRLRIRYVVLVVCCLAIVPPSLADGQEPPLSNAEVLTSRLALADLASEKHVVPARALSIFAHGINLGVLKDPKRASWTITTVKKADGFEFIHADTDGVSIRMLPEVVMFGFTPESPGWRKDVGITVLAFLREEIQGEWQTVKCDAPRKSRNVTFVESYGGGFSHRSGTIQDSFIGIVVGDKVWVCLPRRRNYESLAAWLFTVDYNKGWFEQ